jgi:hypothetical protein
MNNGMTRLLLRKPSQFCQLAVAIYVLLLSGCASTGGFVSGQVLNADTRESIPDVHVIIRWKGGEFALVDTRTVCVYADGTLTDENGKYRFLPWIKPDGSLVGAVDSYIFIYKPGYEEVRTSPREKRDRTYLLKPYDRSSEEHMDYLLHVSDWARCQSNKENLIPVKRAVFDEAQGIAKTNEEKRMVESIRFGFESYEFGTDEAWKRRNSREQFQ